MVSGDGILLREVEATMMAVIFITNVWMNEKWDSWTGEIPVLPAVFHSLGW